MNKYNFSASGITDVGTLKKINQDSFVYKIADLKEYSAGIFAVADGVGGLESGEIASGLAISYINRWWEQIFKKNYNDYEFLTKSLMNTLKEINTKILEVSKEKNIRTATTLSVLLLYKDNYFIVHIGDSRIYRISSGLQSKIFQLTKDHSCIAEKNVNGSIVKKNVLTQCLGNKQDYMHFCLEGKLGRHDAFMVCSDGIYKTMNDKNLLEMYRTDKGDINEYCHKLIEKVKNNGETDNITVITVKVTN